MGFSTTITDIFVGEGETGVPVIHNFQRPPLNVWINRPLKGISLYTRSRFYEKSNRTRRVDLNNRGKYAKMVEICQSEHTNHTHVTEPVLTVSVLVLPQKQAERF